MSDYSVREREELLKRFDFRFAGYRQGQRIWTRGGIQVTLSATKQEWHLRDVFDKGSGHRVTTETSGTNDFMLLQTVEAAIAKRRVRA